MRNYTILVLFWGTFLFSKTIHSQTNLDQNQTLESTILALDAEFWKVYNSCDVDSFKRFLTDDLEFYHDKGGLTKTSEKLVASVRNGLCGDLNMKLRREAVPGSVKVFPLNRYGAIIKGEHLFYLTENGNPERLVESAKFTHVWKNENGNWRMSRVLSYDHQKVSENSGNSTIQLSEKMKQSFIGTYQAPKTGTVTIFIENDELRIKAGKMNSLLFASSETSLFIKEAPIRFEFVKDTNGNITEFTVYEQGKAVETAKRVE